MTTPTLDPEEAALEARLRHKRHKRTGGYAGAMGSIIAALAVGPGVALAQADVYRTGTFGGAGGGPYELACPAGSVMTGLRARHGAWVDALAPVCSRWVVGNQTLGEIEDQPFAGGNGGGPAFVRCEGRVGVVVGLELFQARNGDGSVGHIFVNCGDYRQPAQSWRTLAGSVEYLGASMRGPRDLRRCAPGTVAAGIYGRSGAFVDRVGLMCVRTTARPPAPQSAFRCRDGYVWRVARPSDLVCVTPESRARVAHENETAASRRQPGGGASGPLTCREGFVWRGVFDGDAVCVTPEVRAQVRDENERQLARQAPAP